MRSSSEPCHVRKSWALPCSALMFNWSVANLVSKTEQRIAQQSPKLRCQDSNGASSQVLSFRLKKADTSNLAPGTRSGEGLDSTAFIRNKELSEGYVPCLLLTSMSNVSQHAEPEISGAIIHSGRN